MEERNGTEDEGIEGKRRANGNQKRGEGGV